MHSVKRHIAILLASTFFSGALFAATPDELIQPIQKKWAEIKYEAPEKQQAELYQTLAQESRKIVESNPGMAEPLIWEGIVISSEAGARGGLGALSLAKDARQRLDDALRSTTRRWAARRIPVWLPCTPRSPAGPLALATRTRLKSISRNPSPSIRMVLTRISFTVSI